MLLFLIGLVSGIICGMGIGGGAILIPALVILNKAEQHIAQSTNLLFFIPTAIIALVVHIKNRSVEFKTAFCIIIFGLFGAFIGSKIATNLPGLTLKKWFGIFLMLMGIYEMFRRENRTS